MKNKLTVGFLFLFVILLVSSTFAQSPDPRIPVSWWYKLVDYVENGTLTLTYKTLDAPTYTGAATTTGTYDATITDTTAASETGIYSYISHTTAALTGELIGVRGNVRNNFASPAGTIRGGQFQAGNMTAGFNTGTATGVYSETVTKVPTAASATWTNAKGYEVIMDLDQGSSGHTNTVTNAYMFYGNYNLPTAGTYATVTNGYGIWVQNEAIGGTGQMIDAAFYVADKSHSGGIKGWDYGIDLSGVVANFGTADMKLSDGGLISNPHADTMKVTEAVFQVNGGLAVGSAPALTITAMDTTGAGRTLMITTSLGTFYVYADTSAIP